MFTFHSAPKNYHLAMHIFGLYTTASTLEELDDMVQSAAVVFTSPSSAAIVEKHFQNLQTWLQRRKIELDDTKSSAIQEGKRILFLYYNININNNNNNKKTQRSNSILFIAEKS